jgi:hypothetical protein
MIMIFNLKDVYNYRITIFFCYLQKYFYNLNNKYLVSNYNFVREKCVIFKKIYFTER